VLSTMCETQAGKCWTQGCRVRTREGKPYCPEHFFLNPHASKVLGELAEAAGELDARVVNPHGALAEMVMVKLNEYSGMASLDRMVRDTPLDRAQVTRVFAALKKAGMIKLSKTNRGKVMARVAVEGM